MPTKVVVFDVDGTLTDSLPIMVAVMRRACAENGLDAPADRVIREGLGVSLGDSIRTFFPRLAEDRIAAVDASYRAVYADEEARMGLQLFPGVLEGLEALRTRGRTLAIATGKTAAGVRRILAKLALADRFAAWRSADLTAPKPDPLMLHELSRELGVSKDEMLMVGDTTYDVDMAHAAGVPVAAVTYGAHRRDRLAASRPQFWIDHFDELAALV